MDSCFAFAVGCGLAFAVAVGSDFFASGFDFGLAVGFFALGAGFGARLGFGFVGLGAFAAGLAGLRCGSAAPGSRRALARRRPAEVAARLIGLVF